MRRNPRRRKGVSLQRRRVDHLEVSLQRSLTLRKIAKRRKLSLRLRKTQREDSK